MSNSPTCPSDRSADSGYPPEWPTTASEVSYSSSSVHGFTNSESSTESSSYYSPTLGNKKRFSNAINNRKCSSKEEVVSEEFITVVSIKEEQQQQLDAKMTCNRDDIDKGDKKRSRVVKTDPLMSRSNSTTMTTSSSSSSNLAVGVANGGKLVASRRQQQQATQHLVRRSSSAAKNATRRAQSADTSKAANKTLHSTSTNNNNNNTSRRSSSAGFVTVLEIGSAKQVNKKGSNPPSRSSSFNKKQGTTVTVQIKASDISAPKPHGRKQSLNIIDVGCSSSRRDSVKRSSSVNSVKKKEDKAVQCSTSRTSVRERYNTNNSGVSSVEEDIVVYRLPGEKLGLGLRFEGGARANEHVSRLFVQCCSKGSPAARTRCTWGSLNDGDEIVAISSKLVRRMTRVDCVKALKESPVSVRMRIRHYFSQLALHTTASYDLHQDEFSGKCPDFLQDNYDRRCQTLPSLSRRSSSEGTTGRSQQPRTPRKPTRVLAPTTSTTGDAVKRNASNKGKPVQPMRSSSVPALGPPKGFGDTHNNQADAHSRSTSSNARTYSRALSSAGESAVSGTTRALIERSRSSRVSKDNLNVGYHEKASTLPRKGGNIYVKAQHMPRKTSSATRQPQKEDDEQEAFVDDDKGAIVADYDRATLPKISKVNKPTRVSLTSELSSSQNTNNGVQLVVSSNSFVTSTLPRKEKIRQVLTVQEKLSQDCHSLPPQAEVYVNLLDGDLMPPEEENHVFDLKLDDDSMLSTTSSSHYIACHNSQIISTSVDESDETASSISTLSTIQSRHVTPMATPKRTTPRSSFTTADKPAKPTHFDLAKLLDPFEQLEREFNWDDVTIRPPSAFSSLSDVKSDAKPTNDDGNEPDNNNSSSTERHVARQNNIGQSLRIMEPGSCLTLDRRPHRKGNATIEAIAEDSRSATTTPRSSSQPASKPPIKAQQDNSRRSSSSSRRSSSSSVAIMEGLVMSHRHSLSQDSNDSLPPPPPTLSRLPPDGHEFPPDYRDPTILFQTPDMLSRKSSGSSTGSLDRSDLLASAEKRLQQSRKQRPLMRHDEHSASSVRAKIAMFSNGSGNSSSTNSLTRSLTHGDVRFEETSSLGGPTSASASSAASVKNGTAYHRSMINVSKLSSDNKSSVDMTQSTDNLTHNRGHTRLARMSSSGNADAKTKTTFPGRSQSLLEIGTTSGTSPPPPPPSQVEDNRKQPPPVTNRSLSSGVLTTSSSISEQRKGSVNSLLEQRRRSTLTKLKGLVIPENTNENNNVEEKKNVVLSTPPWKSNNASVPKYSPAFKRKPFTVYSTGNVKPPSRPLSAGSSSSRPESQKVTSPTSQVKSDDSDNDSAVSSGRSSLSHSSVSPPTSPVQGNRTSSVTKRPKAETIKEVDTTSSPANPRVLKKDSVEAINRRNILESCKKSSGTEADVRRVPAAKSNWNGAPNLGKPASRSSSFTIAERKKSLEMMTTRLSDTKKGSHSSQDSLSKRTRDLDFTRRLSKDEDLASLPNGNTSRRSSRCSEGDTSGSSRVTTPTRGSLANNNNSLADTIKDIENRVAYMTDVVDRNLASNGGSDGKTVVSRTNSLASEKSTYSNRSIASSVTTPDDSKWSTLEKKYSPSKNKKLNGDAKNKIAHYDNDKPSTNERPKDLAFTAPQRKGSSNSSKASPGSRNIRELAEKWESRSSITESSPMSSGPSVSTSRRSTLEGSPSSLNAMTLPRKSSTEKLLDSLPVTSFEDPLPINHWSTTGGSDEPDSPKATFYIPAESTEWESFDPSAVFRPDSTTPTNGFGGHNSSSKDFPQAAPLKDRKYSVPIYSTRTGHDDSSGHNGSGVKMRENKNSNSAPSRPSSLIETGAGTELKVFEMGHLGDHGGRGVSTSTSRGSSQADLLDCSTTSDTPKSPLLGCSSRELLDVFGGRTPSSEAHSTTGSTTGVGVTSANGGRRCVSVNDIRRAFEKAEQSLQQAAAKGLPGMSPCHHRMSSLDSTNSDESSIPTPQLCYGSVSSLISGQTNLRDHYGSISSLASSTSLISPQELQGLIDEANQSLEESGTPSHEIMVIVLHREFSAGSIGITLAGGADYESKDITVHKVIPGTLADRDGRIQKGDRVLSINGRSTKGVTHREALSILKAPRAEVVLVLSRSRSVTPAEGAYDRTDYPTYNYINMNSRPPKILESPLDSKSLLSDLKFVDVPRGTPKTVILKKEGTGLGFSLEGGKDSPLGDRPLTIKKIFTGGAADKTNVLKVGDEIISVNSTDCTRMSRIEAWNFMKKLNDGTATLVVRQKIGHEDKSSHSSSSHSSCSNSHSSSSSSENTGKASGNQEMTAEQTRQQLEPTKVEAKR